MKIRFLTSAREPIGYPDPQRPELAIAGRSNAGKSSFINALARQKVAKVSQVPGKTRLLNFFDVGEHYRLVDMPGYGYAAQGKAEVQEWQSMVETYASLRANLVGFLLVMDVRRDWTEDEELLKKWVCKTKGLPLCVLLTKSDKLSRGATLQRVAKISKASGAEAIFPLSSLKRQGVKEVEEYLFEKWIRPLQEGE